jgi:hypothetical protein
MNTARGLLVRLIPSLLLVLSCLSLGGCFVVPLVRIDVLPAKEMARIKVVDTGSGQPIEGATVTCQIYAYKKPYMGNYPGGIDPPANTRLKPEALTDSYAYKAAGAGEYEASRRWYGGVGVGLTYLWVVIVGQVGAHCAVATVEVPGYQSVACLLYSYKPGAVFELAIDSKSTSDIARGVYPRDKEMLPEVRDGMLLIKLSKLDETKPPSP